MGAKRSHLEIYGLILRSILNDKEMRGRKTRVQYLSYLPHDRFMMHLSNLQRLGFIDIERLEVTEKGKEFLQKYEELMAIIGKTE